MIEFDAKLSKDGEIFLLHDDNPNVPATAGASRVTELAGFTARGCGQLVQAKCLKVEPLPLLSQVAERCREHGMMANIEIKPTTGTGPLTGKWWRWRHAELWAGMTPPLLSSFEIDALEL